MTAAEHVERQVAVAVIIAVEEPALLPAMQRIVRRIQVENDLRWCLGVRVEEQIDQQRLDRRRIVADLVVARPLRPAQFQPVQRRLARQRRTVQTLRRKLAGQHRQHRIVPQIIVVVQVLVAQRDTDNPLQHHRADLVLHQFRRARIGEARSKPSRQLDHPVRLTQQQCPRVRRDRTTIKRCHDMAPFDGCKLKQRRATVCWHRGTPLLRQSLCCRRTFADLEPRCTYTV